MNEMTVKHSELMETTGND